MHGAVTIQILSVVYTLTLTIGTTLTAHGISIEPEAEHGALSRGPCYARGPSSVKRASLHLYPWPHAGSLERVCSFPTSLTRWDFWSLPPNSEPASHSQPPKIWRMWSAFSEVHTRMDLDALREETGSLCRLPALAEQQIMLGLQRSQCLETAALFCR